MGQIGKPVDEFLDDGAKSTALRNLKRAQEDYNQAFRDGQDAGLEELTIHDHGDQIDTTCKLKGVEVAVGDFKG